MHVHSEYSYARMKHMIEIMVAVGITAKSNR
jgi:hypothetical protein